MDVMHEINSVERTVGTRTLAAGEARTVTLSRVYDSPIEEVWKTCTEGERVQRWFLPVTGDLRLGGRFQLVGNAAGTIESCDPPRRFSSTWEFGGEVSWIEVRLTPVADDRTRLELEHIALVDAERWAQFGPGAVGVGWDLAMLGLRRHLESGQALDPNEAAAWAVSDEGKSYVALGSRRWGDANMAAGAEPSAALAASDRTTAFYTGSDPSLSATH